MALKRRVVLESPYRDATPAGTDRNVRYAKRALLDCLKRGEAPIASHLLFPQLDVLRDADAEERKQGMEAGHAWIAVCHTLVVYTDHGISPGMQAGIDFASKRGIEIEKRTIGAEP